MCLNKLKYYAYSQFLRNKNYRSGMYFGEQKLGLIPDKEDPNDRLIVGLAEETTIPLMASVVANPKDYVKQQGKLSSCGSHALISCVEMIHEANNDMFKGIQLSEMFHYWWVRQPEYGDTYPNDKGQSLRDGCKVVANIGSTPEKLMPYIESDLNKTPDQFAQGFAELFKVSGYYRLLTLEDIKAAIVNKIPVAIGIKVYGDFMFLREGTLPETPSGSYYGGHGIAVPKYNDVAQTLTIVNSWGKPWGDEGICEMPYEYFNKVCFDIWALVK